MRFLSAILLLSAVTGCSLAPDEEDVVSGQPDDPRRTFCSVGRDQGGSRITYVSPLPHAIISAGRVNVKIALNGEGDRVRSGRVVLYIDAPANPPILLEDVRPPHSDANIGERILSATVLLTRGTHTLKAAVLDDKGAQTGAVAFMSLQARGPEFDMERAARAECRGAEQESLPSPSNPCYPQLEQRNLRLTWILFLAGWGNTYSDVKVRRALAACPRTPRCATMERDGKPDFRRRPDQCAGGATRRHGPHDARVSVSPGRSGAACTRPRSRRHALLGRHLATPAGLHHTGASFCVAECRRDAYDPGPCCCGCDGLIANSPVCLRVDRR